MEQTPTRPTTLELSTVHHSLARAASQPKQVDAPPMGTFTFRIPDELKEAAGEVCKRHGADLSSFLRQCCVDLIADYRR